MFRVQITASFIIVAYLGVPTFGSLDGRIVGGENTTIEEYPYQLALEYFGWQMCGAVIISNDWALTAAHCVYKTYTPLLALRAGSSIRQDGGTIHTLEEVIMHPRFNNETNDFDIAALKVEISFTYGPGVQPIPLAKTVPTTGESVTITGWGVTKYNGWESEQLKVAYLYVIDHEVCNQDFMELYGGITEFMICAGLEEGGEDACSSDSGGPMVVAGKLAGIISWGENCSLPQYPGVYANIALLGDFIYNITGVK